METENSINVEETVNKLLGVISEKLKEKISDLSDKTNKTNNQFYPFNKLYKKYPKLFRQRSMSIKESLMPFGCECDNGWYDLIDKVCAQLQWDTDKNEYPQVEFVQIKEKYGQLCLYYAIHNDNSDYFNNVKVKKLSFKYILDSIKVLFRDFKLWSRIVFGSYNRESIEFLIEDIRKCYMVGKLKSDDIVGFSNDQYKQGKIDGVITFAESISENICEICGNYGILCHKGGWLKTLCKKHMEELGYEEGYGTYE